MAIAPMLDPAGARAINQVRGAAGQPVLREDENLLQGPPPADPVPQVVGITVHLTFARRDTFTTLAQWIEAHRLACATFHILTPYPGTPLFRQLEAEGRRLPLQALQPALAVPHRASVGPRRLAPVDRAARRRHLLRLRGRRASARHARPSGFWLLTSGFCLYHLHEPCALMSISRWRHQLSRCLRPRGRDAGADARPPARLSARGGDVAAPARDRSRRLALHRARPARLRAVAGR